HESLLALNVHGASCERSARFKYQALIFLHPFRAYFLEVLHEERKTLKKTFLERLADGGLPDVRIITVFSREIEAFVLIQRVVHIHICEQVRIFALRLDQQRQNRGLVAESLIQSPGGDRGATF